MQYKSRETAAFDAAPIYVTHREHATILAGLRTLQARGYMSSVVSIATVDGAFQLMDDVEIDQLCERIN